MNILFLVISWSVVSYCDCPGILFYLKWNNNCWWPHAGVCSIFFSPVVLSMGPQEYKTLSCTCILFFWLTLWWCKIPVININIIVGFPVLTWVPFAYFSVMEPYEWYSTFIWSLLICWLSIWWSRSSFVFIIQINVGFPIQTWAPYLPLSWCWVWAPVVRYLQPRLCADFVSSRSYGWSAWIAEAVHGSCWVLLCMLTDRYVKTGSLTL